MSDVPSDAVQLISGLVAHMKQIVGDGACYAMLHYGAVEEGKRFGAGVSADQLASIVERLDGVLVHRTEIVQDKPDVVRLRILSSPLLESGHRALQGVVVGLYEGALTVSRSGRFKGHVVDGDKDQLTFELKRET